MSNSSLPSIVHLSIFGCAILIFLSLTYKKNNSSEEITAENIQVHPAGFTRKFPKDA